MDVDNPFKWKKDYPFGPKSDDYSPHILTLRINTVAEETGRSTPVQTDEISGPTATDLYSGSDDTKQMFAPPIHSDV